MPKVYLSDDICAEAREKMRELMHAKSKDGILIQQRAAQAIMSACQTQERYNLRPQTAADYEKHKDIAGSQAKSLEELTPEELLDYQRTMLGDDYPGKPA